MDNKKFVRKIDGEEITFWKNSEGKVIAKSITKCAPSKHVWDNPIPEESSGEICMRCNMMPEEVMDDTLYEEFVPVVNDDEEVPF